MRVPVPIDVPPSLNVTVPAGAKPVTVLLTVALNVTLWPYTDSVGGCASVMLVSPG